MDAVKSFNAELSSLYEVKPPISKAKMTALTRGAIKGIKFYKHVVQSVEKFILKCKPEYKVPGLYVIDSIVRQSRHQFGADKDVFAPRFAKNMQQTFVNLFKCPPEDKSKVIRVLNLWQKNQVFGAEVVQPLFDLADPNHPIHKEISAQQMQQQNGLPGQMLVKGSPALQKTPTKTASTSDPATLAQLGSIANNPGSLDPNTLAQLQQLHRLLLRQNNDGSSKPEGNSSVHFDKKLLDFDYGSDDDDDPNNPSPRVNTTAAVESFGSILSNPEVLRQLQTLQQSMMNNQHMHPEIDLEKLRKLQEMKQQEDEFDKHLAQTVPNLPFAAECEFKPGSTNSPAVMSNFFLPPGADLSQPPPGYKANMYDMQTDENAMESEVEFLGATDNDIEVIDIDHDDSRSPSRDRYSRRRRSRSKDRSRDRNRRRRSRSRSRSRGRRHNRSRSRSRERERDRDKDKDKEKDREKEKERKKRGLPPVKKDNLSVCSTTLWVGHLSKLVHQEDLSDTFGEFGEIVSIDLIIPRGCAFIVMNRRQDAARCLTKLKNHKMQGKAITLAWAPGKGVKGKELKDYWEGDLGVSYIPFPKLKPDIDIEMLEDGGMLDEDTLPQWMKDKMNQDNGKVEKPEIQVAASFVQLPEGTPAIDTSQPPPLPTPGLLQPPPMSLPLVSPFQMNNRLLGMPPGMMPNVPLGVPPPNLQGALMNNQLMGMNNPFGQGLLQHPPMQQMPPPIEKKPDLPPVDHSMLPFNILPPQPPPAITTTTTHDDMDVEMEDDDKMESSKSNDNYNNEKSSRHLRHDDDRRDDRNRSRDRDRDRNRSRRGGSRERRDDRDNRDNRDGRDSRDGRDVRDGRDSRDGSRGDRRERSNRWGDNRDRRDSRDSRDSHSRDNSHGRDDRRDREKALNDRLREMAGDNSFRDEKPPLLERPPMFQPPPFNNGEPLIDIKPPERFNPRRRRDDFDEPVVEFEPPPPRDFNNGPPRLDFKQRNFDGPPLNFDGPPLNFEGPPIDFERPPIDFEGPPIDFEEPPDFEGPPIDFEPPLRDFDGPPMDFEPPPRPMMHPRDRFDDRRRGPPPPEFFGPREPFGPRGPRFRGPGPDGFLPRGPPDGFMPPRGPPMMRPPHMFHPRGPPHMRGPRPGPPWMDGPPMRPNFPPRFDGPPDFFRGGPPGPPGFDDPHHPRHRRFNDNRRGPPFRPDFEPPEHLQQHEEPPQETFEKPEKRSRWGNNDVSAITEKDEVNEDHNESIGPPGEYDVVEPPSPSPSPPVRHEIEEVECKGNTTPLHDEQEEQLQGNKSEDMIAEPEMVDDCNDNDGGETMIEQEQSDV